MRSEVRTSSSGYGIAYGGGINDRMKRTVARVGITFSVGAAVGIWAGVHFTNHSNKLLSETVRRQSDTILALGGKDASKTAEIADLTDDNKTLYHDNQALWREHGHVIAIRKGKYQPVLKHPEGVSQPASAKQAHAEGKVTEATKERKEKKGIFGWLFRR